MFKRREFRIIFLIMLTEVLGFSLILPFLPLYIEKLGASPLVIGLLMTTFSIFQFISAPIMGKLSDTYGRKTFLILSQISTFISFVVLGFAKTIPLIFLSRIIDGMLGSNFTIAQAYLGDITSKEERTKTFGISGMAFGIGFLIGPAIGGFLSQISFSLPAFISAGIALFTILLTKVYLKETIVKTTKKFSLKEVKLVNFKEIRDSLINVSYGNILIIGFLYSLSHLTFTSGFALYANRQLGIEASEIGFVLTYIGLVSIILRGGLLGKLIDRFSEEKLLKASLYLALFGLLGTVFTHSIYTYLFFVTFFATGSGLLHPLLNGNLSKKAGQNEQGKIMGISGSLGSMAQITGPLISGATLTYLTTWSLGLIASIFMVFAILVYNLNQAKN